MSIQLCDLEGRHDTEANQRPTDPFFYEAQAVVLCNMQQHKQALEIYVFKMHDYDKAEE